MVDDKASKIDKVMATVGMAFAMGGMVAGANPPDVNSYVDSAPGVVDPAGFDPSEQGSWNDLAEGMIRKKEEEEEETDDDNAEDAMPSDDPPSQNLMRQSRMTLPIPGMKGSMMLRTTGDMRTATGPARNGLRKGPPA